MNKKKLSAEQTARVHQQVSAYPEQLFTALQKAGKLREKEIYVTGGALRDWLLGGVPSDLDFTIDHGAFDFVTLFREIVGSGTIVPLGMRHDDTCRIVLDDITIDVSGFRRGTLALEEDLAKRDFTINAMAVNIGTIVGDGWDIAVIDPMGGLDDLQGKILKSCPGAFTDDPLRMIRAFRFSAMLGYAIDLKTENAIISRVNLINMSASERIRHELDQIMMTGRAHQTFTGMHEVGLLEWLVPEIYEGAGVKQPAFHHLDVFEHSLLTLDCIEQIIESPNAFFQDGAESVSDYFESIDKRMLLKWAALFHDVGKPVTQKILPEKDGRVTFYGHDIEGAEKFVQCAERLKWSKKNRDVVALLINMHMHPFHLCNVIREKGVLTNRSRLKICRKAGGELAGLFALAMADSIAGQGVDKPKDMEEMLSSLYGELEKNYHRAIEPVLKGPKMLTGHDLVDTLGLSPGPEFKIILEAVDLAVLDKEVTTRDEALVWVEQQIKNGTLPQQAE